MTKEAELAEKMELCFRPFSLNEDLQARTTEPSGTLLVLPDGKVKVTAPLPYLCADLKQQSLAEAWEAYRAAWTHPRVVAGLRDAAASEERLSEANRWVMLEQDLPVVV